VCAIAAIVGGAANTKSSMLDRMELSRFDEVADALQGLVPRELGQLRYRARRFGIKVWFDAETPPSEHYEAQVISRDHVAEALVTALEVGFHSEHPQESANEAVATHLLATETQWRPRIGDEACVGPFLGRNGWRRLSETWPDPDLDDGELAFEVAARLTDYIVAIEPVRRAP
jgi:hypothetical protein